MGAAVSVFYVCRDFCPLKDRLLNVATYKKRRVLCSLSHEGGNAAPSDLLTFFNYVVALHCIYAAGQMPGTSVILRGGGGSFWTRTLNERLAGIKFTG